jgi:hypothetical protein
MSNENIVRQEAVMNRWLAQTFSLKTANIYTVRA